jgi:hypothetical protein
MVLAIVEKSAPPKGLSKKAGWFYEQIQRIEQTQLKQLERLTALRAYQRREIRLREKTRLASRQVESQVILCSLMFGALILFTLRQYPQFLSHPLFWISIALFLVGLMFFLLLKRSFRCQL